MTKREAGFLMLAILFAFAAILFLVMFVFRNKIAKSSGGFMIVSLLICIIMSVVCGVNYYKEYYLCKICKDKATIKSPIGKYCEDCIDDALLETAKYFNFMSQ